ncbi:MAG: glycosyltransferase family 9 protein [Syntrophales bacterium]|nr:glycosyltransferase family 9 protein [Syntrophales bacterium]
MIVKGGTFDRPINNILIIQLGDIGDVVWATPTFRAVKETYPQANVSVLVREGFGSLLEADPHLHRIFEVKHYKGNLLNRTKKQINFIRDLRKACFDLVFDLRSDDRGAFMAFFSGAPIRGSMFYPDIPWRNHFFSHLVTPSSSNKRVYGAAEQSIRIIREFGIDTDNTTPCLTIPKIIMERVHRLLEKERLMDSGWITLNPFSRWQYKEWGYEKWAQIIDWLWQEYRIAAVIVGSPEERNRSIDIVKKCRQMVFNFTGKTTLSELAGLLSLSYLNVGVDSAAPHIAAAVGTPTITIYGPSEWLVWAPIGETHSVVTPDCDCAPCHQKGCDGSGTSKCIEELTVNSVKGAIQGFLDKCGQS